MWGIIKRQFKENNLNFKRLGEALGKTTHVLKHFCKKTSFYENATKVIDGVKGYANFELRKIH